MLFYACIIPPSVEERTGDSMRRPVALCVLLGFFLAFGTVNAGTAAPATPTPPTKHKKFKHPIVVADGLEVTYYWIAPPIPGHTGFDIYGEMLNTTGATLDAQPLKFGLYDKDGNVLGSVDALPLYHVIPSGKPMPFHGDSDDGLLDLKSIDTATPIVCGNWGETNEYVDKGYGIDFISIEEQEVVTESATRLQIQGTVRNNGANPAYIRVQAAIYDRSGRFIGSDDGYTGAAVPTGKTGRYVIDTRPGISSGTLPLDRVKKDDYSVELWAGVDDQVWFYGC